MKFVDILCHLAYDAKLFNRSVEILVYFALLENVDSIHSSLKSLFTVILSGTHAPIEERAKTIKDLIGSENQKRQELGLDLLSATLEAWHFSSSRAFEFGARSRDFGYHPKTRAEVVRWFSIFIDICANLAISDEPISSKARKLLADKMRGLWTRGEMYEFLEKSAKKIHDKKAWNDGWLAIRGIIQYDSESFSEEALEKLYRLEKLLKPTNLLERARTFALTGGSQRFDLEDDFSKEYDAASARIRVGKTTREIGVQVAQDHATLSILLPELVSTYAHRLSIFGQGLADGYDNKQELWEILCAQLEKTHPEKRQIAVLLGFLSSCAESAPEFYASTLDSLVHNELLGKWLPIFQGAETIDQRGVERLHESLDAGLAEVEFFRDLAWGRRHEDISDDNLASLLRKLLSKEKGDSVVGDILGMRFHEAKRKQIQYSRNLIEIACDFLANYSFTKEHLRRTISDYDLA